MRFLIVNNKIKKILNTISQQNQKYPDWKNNKIIRVLTVFEIFILSYKRIEKKVGKLEPEKLKGIVSNLIKDIKDEKYKIIIIKNKNGYDYHIRDKLVQEATKIILSSIFNIDINNSNIKSIKSIKSWKDTTWLISGQMKATNNMNYNLFFKVLEQKITDHKFLRLIRKILKCQKEKINEKNLLNTFIISLYIENLKKDYIVEQNNTKLVLSNISITNYIKYTFYKNNSNHFLISVNGTKLQVQLIKEIILDQFSSKYNLHIEEINLHNARLKDFLFLNLHFKCINNNMITSIPIKHIIKDLSIEGYCNCNGVPVSNTKLINYDIIDLMKHYTKMNRKMMFYYSGTSNFKKIKTLQYILKYSLAKTMAHKKKTTVTKIFKKYKNIFHNIR